jgi:hypothetical protein
MIALRLVRLIETHSEELSEGLTRKLLSSHRTRELRKVPEHELHQRCHEIYRNLSDWLLTKTDHDIEEVYKTLGARRAQQGVPLAALLWAILLTKEHLWGFSRSGRRLRRAAQRVRRTRVAAPAGSVLRPRRLLRHRGLRAGDRESRLSSGDPRPKAQSREPKAQSP